MPLDLVWRVPSSVTLEEAAGVSLVALTAAQAIWYRLSLPAPFTYNRDAVLSEHPEWKDWHAHTQTNQRETINVFIYGASTSVGLYGAQMARLSGQASGKKVRLFGAASKARWPMLTSEPYAYDHLVDYRDDDWAEQITKLSGGEGMDYIYDCISEETSVERCAFTLADLEGVSMAIVRSRERGAWSSGLLKVEPIYGAVWEGLGEEVQYQGFTVKQSPAARSFAHQFYNWLGKAVGTDLKPVPNRIMPGGLARVAEDGFALLGAGSMDERKVAREEEWMRPVSAEKLVYRI